MISNLNPEDVQVGNGAYTTAWLDIHGETVSGYKVDLASKQVDDFGVPPSEINHLKGS